MNDLPAKQARSFYALKSQWSNWFSVIFANTDSLLHSKHFRCETPPVTKKLDKGTEWKQIARREKKKKKKIWYERRDPRVTHATQCEQTLKKKEKRKVKKKIYLSLLNRSELIEHWYEKKKRYQKTKLHWTSFPYIVRVYNSSNLKLIF